MAFTHHLGLVLVLSILCAAIAEEVADEGTCDAKTGQCTPGAFDIPTKKPKRYAEPEIWNTYLGEIENAKRVYEQRKSEYEKTDCSLYNDVIERELSPFLEKGITRDTFEKARKLGVPYQIFNKTVYRKLLVRDAHRCAGVEYFLHRIAPNLGANVTLEFIVNDGDPPVAKIWSADARSMLVQQEPLPVFSYSKPFGPMVDPSFIERQKKLGAVVELPDTDDSESVQQSGNDEKVFSAEGEEKKDEAVLPSDAKKSGTLPEMKPSESFYDILMPTWTFWEGGPVIWPFYPGPQGLGRWNLAREHIEKKIRKEYEWSRKIPIGFFRGTRIGTERDALIRLSASKPQILNAEFTKSHNWESVKDTLGFEPAVEVGLIDHCRYKLLFNFDGVSASARFRHLFLCRSVVLAVNPGAKREFFTDSLIQWYHYIPVASNATESELESLIGFFLAHDSIAEQIADNGYRFIRDHLRLEDVECYWRRLLRRYASLVRYEVEHDKTLTEIPFGKVIDVTGRQHFRQKENGM